MAKIAKGIAAALALFGVQAALGAPHQHDTAQYKCSNCTAWNQPQKPFKLYGNTYYVGTSELSALLITGPKGHVLLDGALPQSAPLIAENIKALGFRIKDVKLILNSHAHFDHAGGIAALQRMSGARVAASAHGAQVLRDGMIGKDDAQFDPADAQRIARVSRVTAVADGETLSVGTVTVKAVLTPGHTPGSTSWTWTSCEKDRCLNMVYADSLTAVSVDGYRFTGDGTRPDRIPTFRSSIARVAALPCDVVVATHPGFTQLQEKLAASTPERNAFIDPEGCRTYAAGASKRIDARVESEKGTPAGAQ